MAHLWATIISNAKFTTLHVTKLSMLMATSKVSTCTTFMPEFSCFAGASCVLAPPKEFREWSRVWERLGSLIEASRSMEASPRAARQKHLRGREQCHSKDQWRGVASSGSGKSSASEEESHTIMPLDGWRELVASSLHLVGGWSSIATPSKRPGSIASAATPPRVTHS